MDGNLLESSSSSLVRVDLANLSQLVLKLLQRKGMFVAEAEIFLNRLVEADQCGLHAEGVGALPQFLDAMDLGDIDPRARIITVKETPATAVLDGSTGIGHVSATRAMQLAIDKARAVGTGTVVIRNSRWCGDVGGIARLAATAGLVGFVTSSFTEQVHNHCGDHALAWGFPSSSGSAPQIVREQTAKWGEWPSHVFGLMSAGLAGGESMSRRRKATRVANVVEYFVQAIDPDAFESRDAMLSKWASVFETQAVSDASTGAIDASVATVPLQSGDADLLAALAKSIKFEISW